MDLRGVSKIGEGQFILCGGMDSAQVVSDKTLLIEHQSIVKTKLNEYPFLEIYPNPVTDKLRIKGLRNTANTKIYNSRGELVKNIKAKEFISVQDLLPGVYFLELGNQKVQFIKQ